MCNRNVDEISCRQKPCLPCQGRGPGHQDDVNAGLKGRPVLSTGVVWIGIVRRFLIPRTCSSGRLQRSDDAKPPGTSAPRTVAHFQDGDSAVHEPPLRYRPKSSPVPLVTEKDESSSDPKTALLQRRREEEASSRSSLRALAAQVNEASSAAAAQARVLSQDLGAILRDGQETTAEVIETVRSEDGKRFRLAVISASGLVGYLAGLKRGMVTRMVYSATGATAMATICYPEDTKTYNRRGLANVHNWIVLGVSLLHRGPQKPLGNGDMRKKTDSNNNGETINSGNTEQSNTNPFAAENIISNLMQKLGSLGHHLEDIKTKLKESSLKTEIINSTNENVTDSVSSEISNTTTKPSLESLSHLKPNHLENLSAKNDSDAIRNLNPNTLPYSPALPVPPKANYSKSKLSTPHLKKDEDFETNNLNEATIVERKRSSEFLKSQLADELLNDIVDQVDEADMQQENDVEGLPDNTFVIPTGGLEEKLQNGLRNIDETPLNKKLTDYYRNMPEEEKTSREKDYDDAYSNRGK